MTFINQVLNLLLTKLPDPPQQILHKHQLNFAGNEHDMMTVQNQPHSKNHHHDDSNCTLVFAGLFYRLC